MTQLFYIILNMSITASFLIIAVVLLHFIFKRTSKRFFLLLWAFVAIRLICPITIESPLSIIPNTGKLSTETFCWLRQTNDRRGIEDTLDKLSTYNNDEQLIHDNALTEDSNSTKIGNSIKDNSTNIDSNTIVDKSNKLVSKKTSPYLFFKSKQILSLIWLIGACCILAYVSLSYMKIKRKVAISFHLRDNIWLCDEISTPFILGFIRPRIYIPSSITGEQSDYVILHEQAHLRKLDQLWKLIGFCILAIHWFNPLVWLSYWLFSRDMELACDEYVVSNMDLEGRKRYSYTLLSLSSTDTFHMVSSPLAFSEVGVKVRIKQILKYKKATVGITFMALLICIVVGVCFLTNPKSREYDTKHIDNKIMSADETNKNTNINNNIDKKKNDLANNNEINKEKRYEEAKKYLSKFSNDSEELQKDGCFVVTYKSIFGKQVWDEFYTNVSAGKPAKIVIAQFTDEGDAVLDYLAYDGYEFYHVRDSTRDNFAAPENDYYEESFFYSNLFDHVEENGDNKKTIVLTDIKDLTYERFTDIRSSDTNKEYSKVRWIASFIEGNENAEVSTNASWHDLAYDTDMSKILIPSDQITKIVVGNGYTEVEKTFSVLDGSNTYNEIMNCYNNLNVAPDDKMELRIGYHYYMILYDYKDNVLQRVTPYKDAVMIDDKMYKASANGTAEQLMLKLDELF